MEKFKRPRLEKTFTIISFLMMISFVSFFIGVILSLNILISVSAFALVIFLFPSILYKMFGERRFNKEVDNFLTEIENSIYNPNLSSLDLLLLRRELLLKCWNEKGNSIINQSGRAKKLLENLDLILLHKH